MLMLMLPHEVHVQVRTLLIKYPLHSQKRLRDLQRLRPRMRRRRAERARQLRAALRVLRQGVRCPVCQRPMVRGTARCDGCCYWACSRCRVFRAPGTFGEPCARCGFEDLHPCAACGLRVPRDRDRCNACRAVNAEHLIQQK